MVHAFLMKWWVESDFKAPNLKKGDNVVIPIPAVDRGPTDPRNIKGVVTQVNDHGDYKVGTKVGLIKGYLSRNQIEFCESETVNASDVPES